eukprot:3121541-Pleurochrysis_carterae.AAC.2
MSGSEKSGSCEECGSRGQIECTGLLVDVHRGPSLRSEVRKGTRRRKAELDVPCLCCAGVLFGRSLGGRMRTCFRT